MKLKAQTYDKLQHIMERYNDHMVHVHIEYNGMLNFELMKKAIKIMVDKVEIFRSKFKYNFFKSYWNVVDYNIDDAVKLVVVDKNPLDVSEKFICQKIDEKEEIQIKVLVVRCNEKDSINYLFNHMVLDGGDLRLLLYYINDVYNELLKGNSGDLPFKNGTRDENVIYDNFSEEDRAKAKKLISYSKKQKAKIQFPFDDLDVKNLKPFIVKCKIEEDLFLKAKANGKKIGVTINDIIVGCFYRTIHKIANIPEGDSLGMPCMIDLRRYLKSGVSEGVCNLTSMMVPNIGEDIGKDIKETVLKIKENMDELKKDFPGLHGLPLLQKVFKFAPFVVAKFLIGTFFKNPLIGISNIGIMDENKLTVNGLLIDDCYMTGSIKYPPYIQLALTTLKNEITNTIAIYGNDKDRKNLEEMFDSYKNEFITFANLQL